MVKGLPLFRAHFAEYQQHYVLIGGAACDVHMEAAGLPFRATKDLDIVLCVEVLDIAFVQAFWEFVVAGGYQQREKSDGDKEFYRFLKPTNENYPAQLELFSRRLDHLPIAAGMQLTPIPVDGEVDSLSAILLDDNYYACLQAGTVVVEDVRVLMPEYLLVFKAKAYLDLVYRKERGAAVKIEDIKKHRLDVLRLFQLLSPELRMHLPEAIKTDVRLFIAAMQHEPPDIQAAGIKRMTVIEVLQIMRDVYGLG